MPRPTLQSEWDNGYTSGLLRALQIVMEAKSLSNATLQISDLVHTLMQEKGKQDEAK